MKVRECVGAVVAAAGILVCGSPAEAQPGGGPTDERTELLELAHRVVVEEAIEVLPKDLKKFYKQHREEIPSQALEPTFPERGPDRRFQVDALLSFPFQGLPRSEEALESEFGEEAKTIGRLPWLIHESYERLLQAFKAGDKSAILLGSDEIAGYLVDLNSPMNLTKNRDGQDTGQHGLWLRLTERLPQAMGKKLKLRSDAANYLDKPKEYVFSVILETYVWIDNVLYLDALARRGKQGYSEYYFDDFARRAGPILSERLSHAAEDTSSYWYTAWTEAGRPEMK